MKNKKVINLLFFKIYLTHCSYYHRKRSPEEKIKSLTTGAHPNFNRFCGLNCFIDTKVVPYHIIDDVLSNPLSLSFADLPDIDVNVTNQNEFCFVVQWSYPDNTTTISYHHIDIVIELKKIPHRKKKVVIKYLKI